MSGSEREESRFISRFLAWGVSGNIRTANVNKGGGTH